LVLQRCHQGVNEQLKPEAAIDDIGDRVAFGAEAPASIDAGRECDLRIPEALVVNREQCRKITGAAQAA
jgi:hypothetical protein